MVRDDDLVVGALIHDVGDLLAPYNHAQIAAAIIRPYVREQVTWIVEQHELFQTYYYVHHMGGDRYARERLRDHRWYESCVDFCERYDQSSFDPAYRTMSLAEFEPLLRQVFSRSAARPALHGRRLTRIERLSMRARRRGSWHCGSLAAAGRRRLQARRRPSRRCLRRFGHVFVVMLENQPFENTFGAQFAGALPEGAARPRARWRSITLDQPRKPGQLPGAHQWPGAQ